MLARYGRMKWPIGRPDGYTAYCVVNNGFVFFQIKAAIPNLCEAAIIKVNFLVSIGLDLLF
jgi:hypothetical protein